MTRTASPPAAASGAGSACRRHPFPRRCGMEGEVAPVAVGGASAEELSMYRSGSAPPTVQGARTAVGSLFSAAPPAHVDNRSGLNDTLSEEEILSHPAYLQYYCNNEHLNPRLLVPMMSKEEWRAAQKFQAASGGVGD